MVRLRSAGDSAFGISNDGAPPPEAGTTQTSALRVSRRIAYMSCELPSHAAWSSTLRVSASG